MSGDHNMNQKPCAGRNCGSTNPNLHSAECFEDYEKNTGMNDFKSDWDTVKAYEDKFEEMFDEIQRLRAELKQSNDRLHEVAKHCAEVEQNLAAPTQEPRCAVIVEVFGKDWRLDYMSLPVGKHKLYTQQYVYTTPPAAQRKPLPKGEWPKHPSVDDPYIGYDKSDLDDYAMQVLAAHGIGENK
jgi:uncharacterized protein YukE